MKESLISLNEREYLPEAENAVFHQGDHFSIWPNEVHLPMGQDYNDIALVPLTSGQESRTQFDSSVVINGHRYESGIMGSPMHSIGSVQFARELYRCGGIPSIPTPFDGDYTEQFQIAKDFSDEGIQAFYAVNGGAESVIDTIERYVDNGAQNFIIDIANGGLDNYLRAGLEAKQRTNGVAYIVAGNVTNESQINAYNYYGIDGARLTVGTGSVCTTPVETGEYGPTVSSILSARRANHNSRGHRTLLIADGGIKEPGDAVKAFALGADVVMMGGQFARTAEAAGEVDANGNRVFYGEASLLSMKKRGAKESKHRGDEGVMRAVKVDMTIEELMNNYLAGLASASTYQDARNMEELRRHAVFAQISQKAFEKSHPHANGKQMHMNEFVDKPVRRNGIMNTMGNIYTLFRNGHK